MSEPLPPLAPVGSGPGCPKCGGIGGHQHVMTESHVMCGLWGEAAISEDSGLQVHRSLVQCVDCGARFGHASLVRKGLA
jgi:hypothetical protein